MTITEALAEIKTISKRIEKKRDFIKAHGLRQGHLRDPFEKEGGSYQVVDRERQAVRDLEERKVALRRGIAAANTATVVEIHGQSRTVADWLTWRRDVAPGQQRFLAEINNGFAQARRSAAQQNIAIVNGEPQTAQEVTFNIGEKALAEEIETLEAILGELDGLLSLKNATVAVTI